MPKSEESKNRKVPQHYTQLEGSERRPAPNAKLLRPADPHQKLEVSIVLRRRPDGPPLPGFEYFAKTSPKERPRLSEAEFAARYGAASSDIAQIVGFAQAHGLTVVETSAARRTVLVSGTVAQMEEAFAVTLGEYQHDYTEGRNREHKSETYRGREGLIYIPSELSQIVIGVFGLDNRRVAKRAASPDPPNTNPLTVPQLASLYDFPTNSAAGQTIAILSEGGYLQSDLVTYYNSLPASYKTVYPMATINPISVTTGNGAPDGETTQDICIAFSAAPGANVSAYFTTFSQFGWHQTLGRVIHPNAGDAPCSVISTSFYMSNGDDAATLSAEGISTSWVQAVHMSLQDAAIQGVTFCVCSADYGVNLSAYFGVDDGKQHVAFPASDPWALAVGGTTVGNIAGSTFDEYVWNDPGASLWGTTGGGVSDYFRSLPPYQVGAGVPVSLVDGHVGRGVPDVAGNASYNSGISGIVVNGHPTLGNGTSASTPLWAGLIAVINAALGANVGFVNPALYALGSTVFRDIDPPPGPLDNGNGGVPGYPAGPGWDAATGWGSPKGRLLLAALAHEPVVVTAIAGGGNFGNTCRGSFVDMLLTINNAALPSTGGASLASLGLLSISAITSSSPDFLVPSVASYPLRVGAAESIDVVLRFQPTTLGPIPATISIFSNDANSPHIISVIGQALAPRLVLAIADTGNFGNVCVGSFRDEPLLLSNSGKCTLTVSAITTSGEFLAPEVVAYPLTIAPGDSLSLPIRFQPTSFGPKPGTLTVISDDPAGPRAITLSGNAPSGKLAVTGSLCFGGVKACGCAERTLSICNVGDCSLHVTGVAFKRKSRHWKLINNPFPATLHPGSCLGVVVRYIATEKCPRCCELVITSDDPATPVKTLDVMAYTVWSDGCCKQCCDDCRKGCCDKRHTDSCCEELHDDCCDDSEEEDC
jgi:kumamolisin